MYCTKTYRMITYMDDKDWNRWMDRINIEWIISLTLFSFDEKHLT